LNNIEKVDHSMALQFTINGVSQKIERISPTVTLLDYLREYISLKGTKEGCAEGDCGACTVIIAERQKRNTTYRVINSCLLVLPQADGKHILTIEGLACKSKNRGAVLEPIQKSMVEGDGTQCGFCTPGIMMSLYAFYNSNKIQTDKNIHEALAGNLCRCTGYRSIVDAARQERTFTKKKAISENLSTVAEYNHDGQRFFKPKTLKELSKIYSTYPSSTLLAGGTDLGISFSKDRKTTPLIIFTGDVKELGIIEETKEALTIGSAVTYSEILPYLEKLFPSFANLVTRIGSDQIRNVGTLCGNIATASPIGDTLPCLMALNSQLQICSDLGERRIDLEDFFISYRKTNLKKGEFIQSVSIPKLNANQTFKAYKVSKRYDQDISAVIGAFLVEFNQEIVAKTIIAFGGMDAIPRRANQSEKKLIGKTWNEENIYKVSEKISKEFKPISDFRASSTYRNQVAGNLFKRFYFDLLDPNKPNQVVDL